MNYFIFIPSYNRLEVLQNTTLKLLTKYNIPNDIITVFVETEEMKQEYEKELNENIILVVTKTNGIKEKRNYLETYGYELQKQLNKTINILHIDDDIESIIDYDKPIENLHLLINIGFSECHRTGIHFFGVSPFNNIFFLQKKLTHTCKYIPGALYGEVIDGTKQMILVSVNHGEDLERSILAYIRDKGIIRINDICFHTKYWVNSGISLWYGGKAKRQEAMKENCLYLADKYKEFCKYKMNKYGGSLRLNSFHKF